jgi:hypothetical protein
MIQQCENFGVFLAIVSFHGSILKPHLGLRSFFADEVHFGNFVDIDQVHVSIVSEPPRAVSIERGLSVR